MRKRRKKPHIRIVEARPEHAAKLAAVMRPADVLELRRINRPDPARTLEDSLKASEVAWTAFINGEPVAMWGLVIHSLASGLGVPWLLTGRRVNCYKRLFMLGARVELKSLLGITPRLAIMIDSEYLGALRLAEWLGFELRGPVEWGPLRYAFTRADLTLEKSGEILGG